MKKSIYKPKEKKLYSYNGINSLFSTLILINSIGIMVYELLNVVIEKNYSSIYIAISAAVMMTIQLISSRYSEVKKTDETKDNRWYPFLFEIAIIIVLPVSMNYFLNNTEVILMIIFIILLIMHTVLVVSSALYEYTLADMKGEEKTFAKITLPLLICGILIVIEVIYLMRIIKQAI